MPLAKIWNCSDMRPRILIVEDSPLLAMELQEMVEDCACAVLGPVSTLADALAVIRGGEVDGAILDVNVGGERVWPVATLLADSGIPFFFTTGYDVSITPDRFRDRHWAFKPLTGDAVTYGLKQLGLC